VLYDPSREFDFERAREAGVTNFVAYPAPPVLVMGLVVAHVFEESAGAGVKKSGDFLPLEAFQDHLDDCIAQSRSKEEKVAVFCMSMLAPFGSQELPSPVDPKTRRALEAWFPETIKSVLSDFLKIHTNLGIAAENMRWAWAQPGQVVMVIPDLKRIQDVAKIGACVIEAVTDAPAGVQLEYMSSVFTGVAVNPGDADNGEGLIGNAIVAGNRALSEGNMALTFHTDSMGQWAFERLTLEESLQGALLNDEFRVHYQPRLDAQTREILGVEALVRWVHPQLGMVSPVQFIPLAEETGLIEPIGEWVLREACRQNQSWRDAGFAPIRVSVNLSPVQFRNPELPSVVKKALVDAGLPTDGLELEVTESMLMNNPEDTVRTLTHFKEMGLKISIDDFGTGYSSLSYLKQFPIDSLKVDRSFIQNVTTNPDDAAITTAIILMGHSLKLNVVAEGVETESQLSFLQVLQCNEVQGFLFSPPVPADRMETMLTREDAKQLD
ncbi:MAG: EAL domain-containing protein, partial [bacterium]|nr:EAL domain-containing protein [bacterium]